MKPRDLDANPSKSVRYWPFLVVFSKLTAYNGPDVFSFLLDDSITYIESDCGGYLFDIENNVAARKDGRDGYASHSALFSRVV
jgi:hypothetical protein